jgi:deoxyribodipyrimidine photolyase-related protein
MKRRADDRLGSPLASRSLMPILRLVLGDQLTRSLSALDGMESRDVVLMAEVREEATYVPHHKQKIAFVLAAMRHFADDLVREGVSVDYVALDNRFNTGTLATEIARAVKRHRARRVVATHPGEWRVLEMLRLLQAEIGVPIEIRDDDRFICSAADFARWAGDRKTFRMEFFYREMRRATGLLMANDEPAGGQWNFDHDNRKTLPKDLAAPQRPRFAPDATTRSVIDLVGRRFRDHFGDLDNFGWAVTRKDALLALDFFIEHCLDLFGDYQDAMRNGDPFLFHALLSPYLNVGMLTAREVCARAELAWRQGAAPLNAVEGFIRQIIGWREYVRAIYWHQMPGYAATNHLEAKRGLPWFYWSGETRMRCMADAIHSTKRHAYAHHIERLMVTGNFALLAGVAPAEIEAWYLAVYIDAYDWVELPNTHGMVMFADGGLLASKPYAASGAYIDRMSDHCGGCAYDVKQKLGAKACPFNYLYWNFMIENEARLSRNPRLAMPYKNLARMKPEQRDAITRQSQQFLEGLARNGTDMPEEGPAQEELDL